MAETTRKLNQDAGETDGAWGAFSPTAQPSVPGGLPWVLIREKNPRGEQEPLDLMDDLMDELNRTR